MTRNSASLALALLLAAAAGASAADKVLFIVAQKDFYYKEYDDPRQALETAGFQVVVAAPTMKPCVPHKNSGQGAASGEIKPDVTLEKAKAEDYRTIVFIGGWGASMYQYAFPGKYATSAYNLPKEQKEHVNRLVNEFYAAKKPLAAICHGVSALAWARVTIDGKLQSPLAGKRVASYEGNGPACEVEGKKYEPNVLPTRWHIEKNGATQLPAKMIGDITTDRDDVAADGGIITAQNYNSAAWFGRILAERLKESGAAGKP